MSDNTYHVTYHKSPLDRKASPPPPTTSVPPHESHHMCRTCNTLPAVPVYEMKTLVEPYTVANCGMNTVHFSSFLHGH